MIHRLACTHAANIIYFTSFIYRSLSSRACDPSVLSPCRAYTTTPPRTCLTSVGLCLLPRICDILSVFLSRGPVCLFPAPRAASTDLTESLPDCRAPLHWCRPDCKALTHYVCRSDWAHRCLTVAIAVAVAASVSVSVSATIFIAVAVTVPNAGAATVAGTTTVAGAVILTSL